MKIKASEVEDNREWLKRSAVGIAFGSATSDVIETQMLREGVRGIRVRSMGGMKHLLTFESEEHMKIFMEEYSEWLEQWFEEVRIWNDRETTMWRTTWVTCIGVPVHA